MGRIIAVVSGKGGTGKTTTVGAVSSCLAALGHKTLCIDLDAGLKNLDITVGMTYYAGIDFTDVLYGGTELKKAVAAHPQIENLYFLPAPAKSGLEDISGEDMSMLAGEIRDQYDYCLLDAPAGAGRGFHLSASCADTAIIVVTPDVSSIRSGQSVAEELADMGVEDIRLLVNRVRPRQFRRTRTTVDEIIDSVGARLIGLVREDPAVTIAANKEIPLVLYESRRAALQFLRTTLRLIG